MEGKIEGSRGSKRAPISLIAALAKENRVSRSDESISVGSLNQGKGMKKERVSRTWIVFELPKLIVDSESLHAFLMDRVFSKSCRNESDFGKLKLGSKLLGING